MSELHTVTFADAPSSQQMEQWQKQLDALNARNAPKQPMQSQDFVAWKHQVDVRGGQTVRNEFHEKWAPEREVRTPMPLDPGHIRIGGMETTIAAAITAGLLPPNYKEGDPLPFDQPTGSNKDPRLVGKQQQQEAKPGTQEEPLTVKEQGWKAEADQASRILQGVTQHHGGASVDAHLVKAVETGEIDGSSLPEGVTPQMAEAVYRGYVAMADNNLSPVHASVGLLNEMLSDAELRAARQAVVTGSNEDLRALGMEAVNRLALEPEKNPSGFLERLEGMPPAERKCLSRNKNTGEWMVTLPGRVPMSFGAAVRLGIVKTSL